MFTGEVDCSYFFTWDTKYACVDEKEALLCGVSDGKQRFDLSALARHSGRPTAHSVCARERSLASFPTSTFGNAVTLFLVN